MIHTLFKNLVKLEPVEHKYYDGLGNQYISVTTLLKSISEKFEDTIAYKRASDQTKAEWKKKGTIAANHGTRIHNALELYAETGQVLAENADLAEAVKSIIGEYKGYHKCYDEICLFNEQFRIAGTADKICAVSNRKDCDVDIADFKTNLNKGIVFYSDYGKHLYPPFEHLHDCNYTKYAFQLSIYAYFFEQLTGRRVRQLYIHYIPADDYMKHRKIPVLYMKNDVKLLLETYKEEVLSQIIINEGF